MCPVMVKAAVHPLFSSSHIAPRTITSTQHSSATMSTQRSRADIELIDGLPTRVLTDFRDYVSTASFWTPRGSVFPRCGYSSKRGTLAKDIDLTFSEKNILHSKRQRTISSRAAVAIAAPLAKKPRSG
jgi:hypothetical protein